MPSPALLRVVNYLCQPCFKMLWRGLGMARSTGKQVIITSSCKRGGGGSDMSRDENLVLVF